jgi:hypothetical protein
MGPITPCFDLTTRTLSRGSSRLSSNLIKFPVLELDGKQYNLSWLDKNCNKIIYDDTNHPVDRSVT